MNAVPLPDVKPGSPEWMSRVTADEGPDHIAPEDRCTECAGWGGWTETNRHGDEIDSPCHHCGETGRTP